MLRERDSGNTVLRGRLGEHCAEREIGGNTVLREKLWEKCAEGEIGRKLC